MAELYKVSVSDSWVRRDGCGTYMTSGEAVTVDGRPMVRLHGGTIVPADGWSADKATATANAAMRIAQLGRLLLDQAEQMRRPAAVIP